MNIVDVGDRQKNYKMCELMLERLEIGLRAISVMYDEFSSDLKSKENIFILKDNIYYRLSSALKHHKLLLEEHYKAENFLVSQTQNDPTKFQRFIFGNPFLELVEKDISAVFDSVVFNIASSFDYLSHIISYICNKDKQNTLYWSKLAKASRAINNDISNSMVKSQIDTNDREFIIGLYDYRSRLIHNKRDLHKFTTEQTTDGRNHRVRVFISEVAKKHFKKVHNSYEEPKDVTLAYLSFWLLKETCERIESILDAVVDEIHDKSNYYANLHGHKGETTLFMMYVDPETNTAEPVSKMLWEEFKNKKIVS